MLALDAQPVAARARHAGQRPEHGEVARAVQEEARRLADTRDEYPGDRGTDHPRRVEDGRIEGDRTRQVVRPDHLDDERLARWQVERTYGSQPAGEDRHQRHRRPARRDA